MSKGKKEEAASAMISPAQVMAERTESELFETSQFLIECDLNATGGFQLSDVPDAADEGIPNGYEDSYPAPSPSYYPRRRLSEQELLLEEPVEDSHQHTDDSSTAAYTPDTSIPPVVSYPSPCPARRTRSHTSGSNRKRQATVTPQVSSSCSVASIPPTIHVQHSTPTGSTTTGSYTPIDVILGRGGRSNNHMGNQEYLRDKQRLQPRYQRATKPEKTRISQELVDCVHARGGRFMKQQQGDHWAEIDNQSARRKASQSLREESDKESRAKKRAKYNNRPSK